MKQRDYSPHFSEGSSHRLVDDMKADCVFVY